jgi:lysyl-tRNA synthetase class II
LELYEPLCTENAFFLAETISVAGRVTNIRAQGANLIFYDIKQEGKRL